MLSRALKNLLILGTGLFVACGQSHTIPKTTSNNGSASFPSTPDPLAPPVVFQDLVYSKDIAPIINRSCVNCHTNGGIAPFALENLQQVRNFGSMLRHATVRRTMPPPGVDNSGSCETFSDSDWLTELDIQKISNWVDTGMRDDDGPVTVPPTPVMGLPAPTKRLQVPQAYTPQPPAGSVDDYRCFVVDPQNASDTYITAIDVLPDKVKILHHVITFKPTSPEAEAKAIAMSGQDGKPGYTCFGAAGVPSTVVGLWAPGSNAKELKDPQTGELLGLKLEANRKLIVQIHYNTTNGPQPDQSSIVIKTNNNVKPVKWTLMVNFELDLAPGMASIDTPTTQDNAESQLYNNIYEKGLADAYIAGGGLTSLLSWELIQEVLFNYPSARDMKVYAVGPHMHKLGTKITVDKIDTAGTNECLSHVPKFDFNWQRGYAYSNPPTIKATDKIKINCNFNTTSKTTKTNFGEGTSDEMCVEFLLVNAN